MKKMFGVLLFLSICSQVDAQAFDIEQLLLDVQKLSQLKQIEQDMENGYQMLKARYTAIRDVAKGSFTLHQGWLDGLLAVSPAVQGYERLATIVAMQGTLVQTIRRGQEQLSAGGSFQPAELAALGQLYAGILSACANDLNDLLVVVTAGTLQASDAERLELIDAVYHRMQTRLALATRVMNEAGLYSRQQAADRNDLLMLRQWYGITP